MPLRGTTEGTNGVSLNNLHRDEATERARLLVVASYDVQLDLTDGSGEKPGEDTFGSETTIRFGCSEPGASAYLDPTAPPLESVTLNGEALDPAALFDGNRITLPSVAADNELVVSA